LDIKKQDIWALGCIIYELYTNEILFVPVKKNNKSYKLDLL